MKHQLLTSATRAAAMVLGVYLSAQAVFLLDPEDSGSAICLWV